MLACAAALATLALVARPMAAAGDEALASPGDDNTAVAEYSADTGVSTYAAEGNTVAGVSPSGTTINVFDYWLTTQSDTKSINKDHALDNVGIN